MVTLTLIAFAIFMPASRGIFRGFLSGFFSLLSLAFLVSRRSGGRRKGL